MEKAIKKEKKIECIIGIFFLLPAVLGVLSFVWCLWFCPKYINDFGSSFAGMRSLEGVWGATYITNGSDITDGSYGSCSSSPAPIYLGLMALAGVYLIKDSLRYLFVSEAKEKEKSSKTSNEAPERKTDINNAIEL